MELLEREEQLATLAALVPRAAAGEGQVGLVHGEPGIGKTSLVRAFAASAAEVADVLWGGCDDLAVARPLGPLADMAREDSELARALRRDDPAGVADALRDRLNRRLRPTVAVVEDVQWADGATLDLLTWLGRRIADTHGVLVLTYRSSAGPGPTEGALARLLGDLPHDRVTHVTPTPLSRGAVVALAGDGDRGCQVWEQTNGNPLFVRQLLRSGTDGVPGSVSDLVHSLVARLSPTAQSLAAHVALSPGGVRQAVLADVDPDLPGAVPEAVGLGLLVSEAGVVDYCHEVARAAVADGIHDVDRRLLHGRLLAAQEDAAADLSRLAHHARLSADPVAMARILPSAARLAASVRSHPEAAQHLRALGPHLPALSPAERAEMLELTAIEEEMVSGDGLEAALAAVDLRRRLGGARGTGSALVVASRLSWVAGDREGAQALCEQAVETLEPVGGDDLSRALAHRAGWHMRLGGADGAKQDLARALELAGEGTPARATALVRLSELALREGDPQGQVHAAEAEESSRRLSLETEWQSARAVRAVYALHLDSVQEALRLNDESMSEVSAGTLQSTYHRILGASLVHAAGRLDHDEGFLRRQASERDLMGYHAAWAHARLLVRRGDADAPAALARYDELAAGFWEGRAFAATLRAEHAWTFRLADTAMLKTYVPLVHDERWGAFDRLELAGWLWLGGHLEDVPTTPHTAGRPEALLAAGRWRQAAADWERRGMPYEQAVALGQGDAEAGRDAVLIADRIGARALAARLRADLRERGVPGVPRPRRGITTDGRHRLTRRQAEALALLAEGLTNEEIGERMFLSARTVEKHVAAVMVELGACDRREAVETARSSGLLSRLAAENG